MIPEIIYHLVSSRPGYRTNHFTETAIVQDHDELVRNIDSGEASVIILLDLSADFDAVDHNTLLQVLDRRFGVTGMALNWFVSYLSGRTHTFQVASQRSGPHPVDCSVHQGFVLGPQDFIAYAEDLPPSWPSLLCRRYATDRWCATRRHLRVSRPPSAMH